MKKIFILLSFCNIFLGTHAGAQSNSWARYDDKMKGDALVREADAGNLEEIKNILAGGGNVNYQSPYILLTPLMAAATSDKLVVVQYLLEHGADPAMKDNNGKTALDRARMFGSKEVLAYFNKKTTAANSAVAGEAPPTTITPGKQTVPAMTGNWPALGTYHIGEPILFYAGKWKRGSVKEIGVPYNASSKNAATGENKYLVVPDAYNWPEWTDFSQVAGLNRENWWTNFFVGQWNVGEVMAVNTRTEGAYERNEFSHYGATEVLKVVDNRTYSWKTADGKTITGNWTPLAEGPGIVLLKAYRGLDWTFINQTNAITMHIRKMENARLFPSASFEMSKSATRPMK